MPHLLKVARLNPNDLPTHVNIGVYYAEQGRTQDATEEFEKVVKLTDRGSLNLEDQRYRASSLLDLGLAYALSKDYPKALMSFQEANRSNPAMVDQTIESINNALANSPSQGGYIKQSLLLRAKGRNKEASSVLGDVVKANPDYLDTRELLNFLNSAEK
jgi:tetratricopeptide (TPR) repeat protein